MKKNKDYAISSGNVFADLGISNPEERLAKAELARQINNLIKQKNLTQTAAAELLEVDQPKISALHKGKVSGFSLERLFRFLNILDQDIVINITPRARRKTKAVVAVHIPKTKQVNIIKHIDASVHASIQARKKNK